jgi:predicted acetyltransferase
MLFLADPSLAYKNTFLEGLREFQAEGREQHLNIDELEKDFPAYLSRLEDARDRTKKPPDRVPASTYWLIDGNEYIGTLHVRHELNEQLLIWGGHIGYRIRPSHRQRGYGKEILRLGLEKANAMGLKRVLLTCDEDNIGSKKIIEYNGGKLENAVLIEGSPVKKLRYWIEIKEYS